MDGSRLRFKYLTRSFVVEKQKDAPSHAYQTGVSCGPPAARLTPTIAWFDFESSVCISSEVMFVCSPLLRKLIRQRVLYEKARRFCSDASSPLPQNRGLRT